jgi:hydroxylamine dehydrogenase
MSKAFCWAMWGLMLTVSTAARAQTGATIPVAMTDVTSQCVACHKDATAGIYQEWGSSKHYRANVGCYECHQAEPGDADATDHNGFKIAVIVSPKDCSRCHAHEAEQFAASHHSDAARILGSLDNVLAEVVEGNSAFLGGSSAAAVNGCWQCHGSEVKVETGGTLSAATWPNSGIGRLNPDGSKGACSACHVRHAFSAAQARRPENCGKCHLGPDHPQREIYDESKHGIAFYANVEKMNLNSSKWIVGEDYTAAPTCATCHMSATKDLGVTHDVGDRISWTLRPAVSEKIDAAAKAKGQQVKPWEDRRKDMQEVCSACHSGAFVGGFYTQFDGLVNAYNDKFAKPGARIVKALKDGKLITTDMDFDDPIEWTWYLLWHHQGRRARHGASMMAPDYTQWHGMFEVAQTFYTEFVPQVRDLIGAGKAAGGDKAKAAQDVEVVLNEVLNSPDHAWSIGKMPAEERERRRKAQEEFRQRYAGP